MEANPAPFRDPKAQDNLDLLIQRGMLAHRQGQFRDAAMAYEKVLKRAPGTLAALNLLADAQLNLGKNARALETAKKALALNPGMASAWLVQGCAQRHMGNFGEAIKALRKSLELRPDHPDTMMMLAGSLRDSGQLDDAIDMFEDIVAIAPDHAMAHYNLGNALIADQQFDEAVFAFEESIRLAPHHTATYINLAGALHADDRPEEALKVIAKALELEPDRRAAQINRGNFLKSLTRLDEAEAQFRAILDSNERDAEVLDLWGTVLQGQGRFDEAIATYRKAIKIDPRAQIIRGDLSTALLANGELAEGWVHYEARFGQGDQMVFKRRVGKSTWAGETLKDKTLLVWREQGVGDDIRFASCFKELSLRTQVEGGRLIIETDPRLITLYARSFPQATVRAEGALDPNEKIDFDIGAGSLPGIMRQTLDSFPAENAYLIAKESRVADLRTEIEALGTGLKVGIAWRSRNMVSSRRRFYTELADWAPLFGRDDIQLINLQYDNTTKEIDDANGRFNANIHTVGNLDLMNDLDGAAALTAAVDLVISASTSVADMAGALGKKTYTYGAHRHPMCLGTDHFPWYPSMVWVGHRWNESLEGSVNNIIAQVLAQAAARA